MCKDLSKIQKHNIEGKIRVFYQNEEFCSMIKLTEMKEHKKKYVICKTDMAAYL